MTDTTRQRRWFGTDGIRGEANEQLTVELAVRLGQAAGVYFRRGDHRHSVLIAKDPRRSSYMIETALVAGFTSSGMDVQLTGPIPTPAVALLTRSMRSDLGVMVSASHNAYTDNGIKLFGPNGYKLSDTIEQEIEALMLDPNLNAMLARGSNIGRVERIEGAQERYIESVKSTLPKSLELTGIRVVIDCANGAGYRVAPRVLYELGAEVIPMSVNPDGININQGCGSTSPQALANKVKEVRADIGIALDGDADRLVVVDEKGAIIDGDQVLALIAETWNDAEQLTNSTLVVTDMANLGLEQHLNSVGIQVLRTRVGDRYVIEAMRKHSCAVGGESSGHIILSDFSTTGDGLIAALQVIAALKGKPASEILKRFEPFPQVRKEVRIRNREGLLERPEVQAAIAGAQEEIKDTGRILVRKSGTEPIIRVMAEGQDMSLLQTLVQQIVDVIESAE